MQLDWLRLHNFRRFDQFEIDFHPQLTVIAARNGQGKTSILEAVASALGPFVGAFDEGRAEHIRRSDARYACVGGGFENEQQFPVGIEAALGAPAMQWRRDLHSGKGRTTVRDAAPLADWGKQLQQQVRQGHATDLPVLRYYSSKRLWISHKSVGSKGILTESRTAGYEDCLSALSSFVQLQEWMQKATLAAQQQRSLPGYGGSNLAERLQGIAQAVDAVMQHEQWSHFHYSHVFDELAMVHPDHGALPISMLSDGVRAMVSLVADLALRCVRLNSPLGESAPKKSKGIVLIDEVDLHLHPAWQQRVLESLCCAFPALQFIVSTHSPQVLSTVKRDNIRVTEQDASGRLVASQPLGRTYGEPSGDVLHSVMQVDPQPPIAEKADLQRLTALVDQGLYGEPTAQALMAQLNTLLGAQHPQLQRLARSIQRQQALKR